jgi:hypothetical protein
LCHDINVPGYLNNQDKKQANHGRFIWQAGKTQELNWLTQKQVTIGPVDNICLCQPEKIEVFVALRLEVFRRERTGAVYRFHFQEAA